ncbi:MAG: response regulator [Candidatus Helarchaeota archaeon]
MIKIMIVEDESALQDLYCHLLELEGYEIVGIATNGEEAVTMFKSLIEKPEIILMDHRMPIKTGIEATREILEMDFDTKIIFTSADESIREEAIKIGVSAFKVKPFTRKTLISNIKKLCNEEYLLKSKKIKDDALAS